MRDQHSKRCVAALLMVAATVVTLGLRDADAAPRCKADGAACRKDVNCCSGLCFQQPPARKSVSGVCISGNPNGEACSNDSECRSGHCADGVCCNTACAGSCFTCDGGTCAPKAAGEECNDGLFCTRTDTCNGSGSCQGSGSTCPLDSQSEVCSDCSETTDSCSTSEGQACGRADGQACSAAYQCSSNFCVDGFCCDSDCTDYCRACSAAKTGGADGTCAPVIPETDPDSDCPEGPCVTGLCNSAGWCGAVEAGTDPNDDCPDGPCVTGLCGGGGVCGVLSYTTACDDGVGCSQADHCDGEGSCVSGSDNGCGTDAQGRPCDCDEASDTCFIENEGPTCSFRP